MKFEFREQLRCYYYILAVAAENPVSFEQGILLLVILDSMFFRRHLDLTYLAVLPEIFGISTQVHVVLSAPNHEMTGQAFRRRVPLRLSRLVAGPNAHVHELADGLAETLRTEYGFVDLPECLGGSWGFYQWRRERLYLESSIEFCRVCRCTDIREIVETK